MKGLTPGVQNKQVIINAAPLPQCTTCKPASLRKKGELAQMVERALSMGEVEGSMSKA